MAIGFWRMTQVDARFLGLALPCGRPRVTPRRDRKLSPAMKSPRVILLLCACFLLARIPEVAAQEARPAPDAGKKSEAAAGKDAQSGNDSAGQKEQKPVESEHTINMGGKVVSYHVRTG